MTPVIDHPPFLSVIPDAIPTALRDRPQWVVWRAELVGGRWTKVPYRADGHGKASTTDRATWATFAAALASLDKHGYDGIGFVFAADDPFCGVDLDHCRDPETGALTTVAATILAELDTYAEVSPSGTGVKAILLATLPDGKGRKSTKHGIELYDRARFFTITGHRIDTEGRA